MDGRRIKAWMFTGALIAGAGCRTTTSQRPEAVLPQANAGKSQFFGGSSFNPKPPTPETVVAKARVKSKGIKPETELAFADTEMDSALFEGKSATERDALFDVARQRYQKVLQADPKNRTAMIGLARLYTHSGDKARAAQLYDAALKANPKDHDLAFQTARMHARFGDWKAAADSCQVALAIDKENLKYPKAIAFYKAQSGNWDEAFAMLLKRMPEADARFFLGRLLLDLDRIDEGREQMALATKADPKHAEAQSVLAVLDAPPPAVGTDAVRQATFEKLQ